MKMLLYMLVGCVVMFVGLTLILKGLEADMAATSKDSAPAVDSEPDKMAFTEYDGKMRVMLGYMEIMRKAIRSYQDEHGQPPETLDVLVEEKLLPAVPSNPFGPGDGSVATVQDGSADWVYNPQTGTIQPGNTSQAYVAVRKSRKVLSTMEFARRLKERNATLQEARRALAQYRADHGQAPAELHTLVDEKYLSEHPRNTLAYGDGSTSWQADDSADWTYLPEIGRLDFGSPAQAMLMPPMPQGAPAPPQARQMMQAARQNANEAQAQANRHEMQALVRFYEVQTGQLPARLQDLVPDYLPAILPNPAKKGDGSVRTTPQGESDWYYNPQTGEIQPG